MQGINGWRAATHAQLAKDSGYSEKQVSRIISTLKKKKVVETKDAQKGKTDPGSRKGYAIHKIAAECFRKGEAQNSNQEKPQENSRLS